MMTNLRQAFLDGIAWMSERTYLSKDGGYHVAEPSELDIRRAADAYCKLRGQVYPHGQLQNS